MGSPELDVIVLQSQAVSAQVTNQFGTISSKICNKGL